MKLNRYHLDIALSAILIIVLILHLGTLAKSADLYILITTAVIGLLPVLFGAYQSFRKKEWASMDLLASIALVFSIISQEWVSAVFIELMLAAARILEDITRDRTEKSIHGLLKLRPETASIEQDGKIIKTSVKKINIGDIVVVGIGERIPIDGMIISGTAAIDESSLTGESLPVDKNKGDKVLSSTLVQSGSLRIKTTHTGANTTIEKVIKLVESAREEKPKAQTLSEKFGKLYLSIIFIGSIGLYLITQNLPLVLAVVLVVCADDVAIAIPLAYLKAIHSASRIGVVIKGGKHLETFGQVKTIVFDKTGTLTTGSLAVTNVIPASGYEEKEVLENAMLADIRSLHPISKAIVLHAKEKNIAEMFPDTIEEKGGKGIISQKGNDIVAVGKKILIEELNIPFSSEIITKADATASEGKTISFVAKNGKVIGFIAASDQIKENAKSTLKKLKELGIEKIVMLTGDNMRAAEAIAKKLEIDEWHADLLPEDKVEIVKKLSKDSPVAMLGDGVNDAAALSIANVGIAMGGLGTEGTIESAQIVLMRDDLSTLPVLFDIAIQTRKISIQDFWIWGLSNGVGLALVFGGIIGPAGAAAYNFLSDFFPLFNSVRVNSKKIDK